MRRRALRPLQAASFALAAALALGAVLPMPAAAQEQPTVIFLVRHAERAEDGTNDPPISGAGQERARLLAGLLADAELTHIHTTDYKRTRQTAGPTAEAAGLDAELYDPRDLASFAGILRRTPGRHLVVGHSNTTPQLVAALGGDAHGEISEFEYDRLYIVTIAGGTVSTVLLRFGESLPE